MPNGTDVAVTDSVAQTVEQKLIATLEPYKHAVSSVLTNVGAGTSDPNDMSGGGSGITPNKARITINFEEFENRGGVSTG